MIGGAGGKTYFLRTDEGAPALVKWWNGYSAILNCCKEDDREFLARQLCYLMDEYGADGFKLDGGIIAMYSPTRVINGEQTKYSPDDLNIAWREFGAEYEYSEYKDTYKGGGKGAIFRLQDRCHSWTHKGINTIFPAALLQGLIGLPFFIPSKYDLTAPLAQFGFADNKKVSKKIAKGLKCLTNSRPFYIMNSNDRILPITKNILVIKEKNHALGRA